MTAVGRSEPRFGPIVALLGGALVIGIIVHGLVLDDGGNSRTSGAEAKSPQDGQPKAAGTGTGHAVAAHSRRGALNAAVSFVCSGQELLAVDPLSAEAMVRRMTSAGTADDQVRRTTARLKELRERLSAGSGPITLVQGVIAGRVDSYASGSAQVALWNVSVIARAEVASPQATWTISTLELVWRPGGWRLNRETVQPGPAPLLDDSAAPATAKQLQTSLAGFTELGDAE